MTYQQKYRDTVVTITASFFLCFFVIFTPFMVNAGSLKNAMKISSFGIKAQSERMKIVAENIANSDTIGTSPNEDPYRRKVIYFENEYDPQYGVNAVKVRKISVDNSEFKKVYKPDHPAADAEGYIRLPNVDRTLESMDMRASQRSYEANISVIETTKKMMERSLDLMR